VRDSSVGGRLLWPANEPWPYCMDAHPKFGFDPQPPLGPVPLVPVLQLYAADVPDLPFPPGTDLLQLLWCPYHHAPYYAPRPLLPWRAAADINGLLLAHPPQPTDAPDDHMPAPCILHPERVIEYPHWDLPVQLIDALDERFDWLKRETG